MIMKEQEINEFIKRRFGDTDAKWLTGNCYWFSVILVNRFDDLEIYYEPIYGHFYAGKDGKYFDASGEVVPEYKPILFEDIKKEDRLHYEHIVRDCVK